MKVIDARAEIIALSANPVAGCLARYSGANVALICDLSGGTWWLLTGAVVKIAAVDTVLKQVRVSCTTENEWLPMKRFERVFRYEN